jgi:parallel beta-helix repeat protein
MKSFSSAHALTLSRSHALTFFTLSLAHVLALSVMAQGDLTPPGAPAPTMKTLQQIEPRTPISSVPFTINQAGSYYLATNLTGVSGQSGIIVAAHNVTIDLGGFELAGVPGALNGIVLGGGVRTNLAVRNGTIRAWPIFGVNFATGHAGDFESLRLLHNSSAGLSAGEGSRIKNCTAQANGGFGIVTVGVATIETCNARLNRGGGINAGRDSTVLNCIVSTNTGVGILGTDNLTIQHCVATRNTGTGIEVDNNCTIAHCTASNNGTNGIDVVVGCTITDNAANSNSRDGIAVNGRNRVFGNTATGNGTGQFSGAGFFALGVDNHIEGNNAVDNDIGFLIEGTFNLIIKNKASGNATNFTLDAAMNREGPIVADPIGAQPWANFAY